MGRGHTTPMAGSRLETLVVEPSPLAETKLAPPRVGPEILVRGRLLGMLDGFRPAALTLVAAPVGFGKTILVQSWAAAQSEAAVAWVSLDAGDNDPARLWTYIATAVDRIRSGLGRNTLQRLRVSGAHLEAAVDELGNALAGYNRPVAIVLDDLHALTSEASTTSIAYLIEHLPAGTRVIATTREDPPIHLSRLRGRAMLKEIRSRDLAFTVGEARTLVVELEHIDLDGTSVEQLVERTEGWPAGLYLAALWLRRLKDPRGRVREFAGDHRHVADYLTSEVLDALDPKQREFLLRTSVFGRFTAPLCDAVLGRDDSAVMIGEIEQSNLFLVSLDARGEWYRYHHLFAELLQLELAHADPTAVSALQGGAAAWFRERGLIGDAVEQSAAAGDERTVAELLSEHHATLIRSGREATLLRWADWLSESVRFEHPDLLGAEAIAASLIRRPASERGHYLALADRARVEHSSHWTPYAEALYSLARAILIDGDVGQAAANARRGIELAGGGQTELPSVACLAYALLLSGNHAGAREYAERAIRHADTDHRSQGVVSALAVLALVEADQGSIDQAEAYVAQALQLARADGIDDGWVGGLVHVAYAATLAGGGQLTEAEREAERGELLRRTVEPTVENTQARLVLAGIRAARGKLTQAAAELARARRQIAGFADPGCLPAVADRIEAVLTDAADRPSSSPIEAPTVAELAVLELLPTGLSQREIGAELYLSMNTVKTHVRELYRKLGVRSRPDAVMRAAALGLLDQDESPR